MMIVCCLFTNVPESCKVMKTASIKQLPIRLVIITLATLFLFFIASTSSLAANCKGHGVYVQVLGSGGPEVQDKRASSSYLVWVNGKAHVLIDSGGGAALRFGQSGAHMEDLTAVLFSHFHIDHSADFPALIKSSFFGNRKRNLLVFGPDGNDLLPSTEQFVQRLFDSRSGVWPYMSDYLPGAKSSQYTLVPKSIPVHVKHVHTVFTSAQLIFSAIPVHHGPLPALAWKVAVGNKSVVFSGDMNGQFNTLQRLARNADLLVAHNAVPETVRGVARNLHMPPSVIGKIAAEARVGKLVLSHRMLRTLGKEKQTRAVIRQYYQGALAFADDLSCYPL